MARHLRLTIDIAYEYEDGGAIDAGAVIELSDILRDAADHLANRGFLTGEHPAIVTEWHADVRDITA